MYISIVLVILTNPKMSVRQFGFKKGVEFRNMIYLMKNTVDLYNGYLADP